MTDAQPIKFKPRKDKFLRTRGGSSRFFNIYCSRCRTWLLLYQKDGPGKLFRLYLDRIFAPPALADLHAASNIREPGDYSGLTCTSCGAGIAIPMVYAKEHRLALRLIKGSFVKQSSDGSYPPPDLRQPETE